MRFRLPNHCPSEGATWVRLIRLKNRYGNTIRYLRAEWICYLPSSTYILWTSTPGFETSSQFLKHMNIRTDADNQCSHCPRWHRWTSAFVKAVYSFRVISCYYHCYSSCLFILCEIGLSTSRAWPRRCKRLGPFAHLYSGITAITGKEVSRSGEQESALLYGLH